MYEDYYGFVQPPFSLTPDPRFLYRSESHDLALQQVWQAIRRKEGFIVLTGDIGTGKTTLCRTLLEQFDETTFTALILNPFLSVEELLREVLLSFGVVSKDALKSGRLSTASKHELIRTLHDFLLSLVPLHGSAVLIIDEAQHLSPDVLEEIRVLSNLETNDQKLLQIVIVGQLNLLDVLHKAELRQLDQRISIRCSLKALTGLVDARGGAQTVGLQQPGDPFGVVLVHLAPEGAHHVGLVGGASQPARLGESVGTPHRNRGGACDPGPMDDVRAVVLVEGVSDQAALEALARRRGRDLAAEGIRIVSMGGATNVGTFLERYGPHGQDVRLAGLCDAGEADHVRRRLADAGLGLGSPAPAGWRHSGSTCAWPTWRTS